MVVDVLPHMWLLNANIFGRKCCETVTADSGKLRSFVLREKHEWKRSIAAPTKRDFCDCSRNMGYFLFREERIKRFMNVHLHCIVSNMNRISKMLRLPHPGNISADAHGRPCALSNLLTVAVSVGLPVEINNPVSPSQARFPQLRVIERFFVEGSNKHSNRGTL